MLPENPYKHIERIGRICYKSEQSITDTSAEPFIKTLFNRGHHAMLEHFRFIVEIGEADYGILKAMEYDKYITLTDYNDRYIVSASARGLNDLFHSIDDEDDCSLMQEYVIENIVANIVRRYECKSLFSENICTSMLFETMHIIDDFNELSWREYRMHAWYSVHFVCDRGVTHEMVRHRDASFAQESTRYCDYNEDKFGGEITFIKPCFWSEDSEQYRLWKLACRYGEKSYRQLTKMGAKPQEARSILPNSLKSEIVITAQMYEWEHIFDLRVLGKTGAPHPQMLEVMEPVYCEMIEKGYIK
jgi:thymidylate synthase (FAD)